MQNINDIARSFVEESNRIEGILHEPTDEEIEEFNRFMALPLVTVEELERFVKVYQPEAVLRSKFGLDVMVGDHVPPKGGHDVLHQLQAILNHANDRNLKPYSVHVLYEKLHPFTDCNGRSGRMLWAWQMRNFPLGFLHTYYYQSLSHHERN